MTTTIDLDLQDKAREAIEKILRDPSGPAAALVAIDPHTGAVKAMFGGTNFHRSQFNLATQAERQPGSSFKPIVLAAALRKGIAPATHITSKPIEIDAGDRIWPVTNYEGSYLGSVDLTTAMVHSDNSVYAQLTNIVGPKVDRRDRAPARDPLEAPRVLLDRPRLRRRQPARHGPRLRDDRERREARGRVDHEATGRASSQSVGFRRSGKVAENEPVGHAALSPGRGGDPHRRCSRRSSRRARARGRSSRAARSPARPARTTTTRDAWFVGYTPDLVVAVWVGYPNELKPMETEFHGEPVAGGTLPALIWKAFMGRALAGKPATSFTAAPYLPTLRRPRRVPQRQLAARQRLLPGDARDHLLRRPAAGLDGDVLRERGVGPGGRRAVGRLGARRAPVRARCSADVVYVPAKPRTRPGEVVEADAAQADSSPRTGPCASGSRRRRTASCRTSSARACRPRASGAAS